jgi:phospholipase/carboxylesterase
MMPKLGQLDFIFKGQSEAPHAVIVCHGYGASMHDLAPIGEWMEPKTGGAWYFLQGPLEVPIGPYVSGRAWFPIDMMKLQMATARGEFASLFENDLPKGIDVASEQISEVVEILLARHDYVHLAGFSQGAMMSAKSAMGMQEKISSLSMLSGVLVAKSLWQKQIAGNFLFKTFQSHGIQDPVLPIAEGRKLRDYLLEHNPHHLYHEFSGGHEIPMSILNQWHNFLSEVMK